MFAWEGDTTASAVVGAVTFRKKDHRQHDQQDACHEPPPTWSDDQVDDGGSARRMDLVGADLSGRKPTPGSFTETAANGPVASSTRVLCGIDDGPKLKKQGCAGAEHDGPCQDRQLEHLQTRSSTGDRNSPCGCERSRSSTHRFRVGAARPARWVWQESEALRPRQHRRQ